MIATADLGPDRIIVHCPARMAELVKEIPGARFQPRTEDEWRIPRTLNAAVQLVGQLGFAHLELSPELREQVAAWKAAEGAANALREDALTPSRWSPARGLYGYQVPAVDWAREADSGILGDDPGTGKTAMASAWIDPCGPTLIVCPKAVQHQWAKQLRVFRPEFPDATVLDGSALQRRKGLASFAPEHAGAVLIVSYDQLPLHSRLAPYGAIKLPPEHKAEKELNAIPWHNVIADEAHRMFNPKTRWTRAGWWLGQHAARRLALTGTPSENSPLDFWALLHFVAPEEWPSRSKAQSYYMTSTPGFFGGVEVTGLRWDRRDEWDRLTARRFLRRSKALVLPELPAKVYEERRVALPPKIRKVYEELRNESILDLDHGLDIARNSGVLYARLSQAAAATLESVGTEQKEYTRADGGKELREVPIVRLCEPSPKVDAAIDALSDLGNEPVMISARSRQLLNLLAARLEKVGTPFAAIFGGMRADEIEHAKEQFNDGHVNILLLSVSSAAEGMSLTRGSTIIRLDRSPKRRDNEQAIDRMHGTGRGDHTAKHLLIIDLVSENTVEQKQLESLADKDAGFEELFRDADSLRRALS